MSDAIDDLESYYANEYDILLLSEEEDQIYEVCDGVPIYRTGHQLATLLAKVDMPPGSRVIDFGCAKGAMMRALAAERSDIDLFFFDVSDRYIPFWREIVSPSHWAIGTTPAEWSSSFDVVTAFFSLEHVGEPLAALESVGRLLRPGGVFYCIVPNVLTNVADLIVVDHVNHFNVCSLRRLFSRARFRVSDIDERAHRGALVAMAQRASTSDDLDTSCERLDAVLAESAEIARYWTQAGERVRRFESTMPAGDGVAIYGAGFYGAFIAANMNDPGRVVCHLDQNPYLQGRSFNGKPIVSPQALPPDVDTIYVGLNPAQAKRIIADIEALSKRNLRYFYL